MAGWRARFGPVPLEDAPRGAAAGAGAAHASPGPDAAAPSMGGLSALTEAEPRLIARRAEVARAERSSAARRRRLVLGGLLLIGLVGAGSVGAALSPALSVKSVVVVGAQRTGADAVRAHSGVRAGEPLIRVDAGGVAQRLTALPWVASATVERRWPSTVVIRVVERVPVAVVVPTAPGGRSRAPTAGVSAAAVSEDGVVLTRAAHVEGEEQLAGLPPVVVRGGVPGGVRAGSRVAPDTRQAVRVVSTLDARVRPWVRRVTRREHRVVVWLGDGTQETAVEFDPFGSLPMEQRALATLVERIGAERLIARTRTVKLDVPDAPVLTPRRV